MGKYKVLDLFSGVGGLSYGFHKNPMFCVKYGVEIDEKPHKAYTMNYPNTIMYRIDIKDLELKHCNDKIDVIIGGPPCQAFSTAGKRLLTDPRAQLFKEYCRVIEMFQPKLFLFENVTGILTYNNGETFEEIINTFSDMGYSVHHKVLDASDYGVPQIRKRVIIVGTKGGIEYEFPKPIGGEKVTLRKAIGDLEYKIYPHIDHTPKIVSEHLYEYVSKLPYGGDRFCVEEKLRPKSGFNNSYARLSYDKPSPTITRNFTCISSARCIHPTQHRTLTIREGARIQTFPDTYKFYGSKQDKCKQIGNAVPPILSMHLAKSIEECLER